MSEFNVGDKVFVMSNSTTAGGIFVSPSVDHEVGTVIRSQVTESGNIYVEFDSGMTKFIAPQFLINMTNIDKTQKWILSDARRLFALKDKEFYLVRGIKYSEDPATWYGAGTYMIADTDPTENDGYFVNLAHLSRVTETEANSFSISSEGLSDEDKAKIEEFANGLRKQAPPTVENRYIWITLEGEEVLGIRCSDGDYACVPEDWDTSRYIYGKGITSWRPAKVE